MKGSITSNRDTLPKGNLFMLNEKKNRIRKKQHEWNIQNRVQPKWPNCWISFGAFLVADNRFLKGPLGRSLSSFTCTAHCSLGCSLHSFTCTAHCSLGRSLHSFTRTAHCSVHSAPLPIALLCSLAPFTSSLSHFAHFLMGW